MNKPSNIIPFDMSPFDLSNTNERHSILHADTPDSVSQDERVPWISDYAADMLVAEVKDTTDGFETVREQLRLAVDRLNAGKWDTAKYAEFGVLASKSFLGLPFKVRGSIKTLHSVAPEPNGDELGDKFAIEIEDQAGNVVESATIRDDDLIAKVRLLFGAHQTFDFLGCIVPKALYTPSEKPRGLTYAFLLADITASDDPLQMIQATENEIAEVEKLLARLASTEGAILEHIRSELVDIIEMKALEISPLLERCLMAIIVQALSDGYDASRSLSHKLHTLAIGSPGNGKKLLAKAAQVLNPVYQEAHPAKITIAGIAGRAVYRDGQWQSDPGKIPQAHRGVFVVQDFHHVERKKEIMGVLSMVMEDGQIIDSSAANKKHHALTSIHLDMNKHSDVFLSEEDDKALPGMIRLTDLGLSMNVLTRFDFVTDIPRDTERQMEIALMMHTGTQRTAKHPGIRADSEAVRKLKVLVAYLRTRFAEIEIPASLSENHIRVKQQELLDANRHQLDRLILLGDFQTRMSNSVHKFIYALARGNARAVATVADVEEAFRFIATKLEFVARIEPFDVPDAWDQTPLLDKVKNRREFICNEFEGKEVSVEEVHAAVSQKYDQHVSATTIRRDLKDVGIAVRYGVFRIGGLQNGKVAD